MSELEVITPALLIHPATGELLDASPEEAIRVKTEIRDIQHRCRDANEMCNHILLDHMRRSGQPTSMNIGGVKVEKRQPVEYDWDIDLLRELLNEGLPEDRWNQLVTETITTTHKVSQTVAKQIAAADEKYARIIDAARRTIEKPATVYVK